jgi:hypothetical protein
MDREPEEQFLLFKEALEIFAGSAATLRRRIADGSIPVRQLGGKGSLVEIPRSALDANQRRQRQTDENNSNETSEAKPSRQLFGPNPNWMK